MRKRERGRSGGDRLRIVTGVLLVAGAMVGLAMSVVVFNAWRIALFAGAYEEAVFVVERECVCARQRRDGLGDFRPICR